MLLQAKDKTSGKDSNGNTWQYDDDTKTLTFSGKGIIYNSIVDEFQPGEEAFQMKDWYAFMDKAEHLIIRNGITGIGFESFVDFEKLKSVDMAEIIRCTRQRI